MDVIDFFRLAFQSGAKYEPETNKFQMGPAEAHNFSMFQQQEQEFQQDMDHRMEHQRLFDDL